MRVKPVLVAMAEPDWSLDTDALKAAVTPRTRAILLNSPANPSGKILPEPSLRPSLRSALSTTCSFITDEIYEYFVYDGAEHISAATLPGMRERTIVLSGFSKTFSITGWRLGYATADARWMPSMAHFHDLTIVCAPAPSSTAQPRDSSSCRQLLQATGRRPSGQARAPAQLAACRGHGGRRSAGRPIHPGQRNAPARQERC